MKNWKIPVIILALLIIAMTFRWHTEKTSYTGDFMAKVVVDRWNGSVWEEKANKLYHWKDPVTAPWIPLADSSTLTIAWYSITGLDSIWLVFALSKKRNKEKKLLIREAGI